MPGRESKIHSFYSIYSSKQSNISVDDKAALLPGFSRLIRI